MLIAALAVLVFSCLILINSESTMVYSTGSVLSLACSSNATYWQLHAEGSSSVVIRNPKLNEYVCAGQFEAADLQATCRPGVIIDPTSGSSIKIEHLAMSDAGKYGCVLENNSTLVYEKWHYVTVVDDSSKKLTVTIDNTEATLDEKSLHIMQGSFLSVACSATYSGFVEPNMELIVRRQDGTEVILTIKPRKIDPQFELSEEVRISGDYLVAEDDKRFEILCIIYTYPSNSSLKTLFQVNEKSTSTAENGKLVGITIGVSIAIACVAFLIVIAIQRRKQREYEDIQRPIEYEHVQPDEISQPSMFGATLDEIMQMQKLRLPHIQSRLPWIQTDLSKQIILYGGATSQGILRVPGDTNKVKDMKNSYDRWESPEGNRDDYGYLNALASLLKRWFRELGEPLFPSEFHYRCIDACENAQAACELVNELPEINQLVLRFHIQLLRELDTEASQMNAQNFAMIIGPSIFHCFERGTMKFTETLINNLDTLDVKEEMNELLHPAKLSVVH